MSKVCSSVILHPNVPPDACRYGKYAVTAGSDAHLSTAMRSGAPGSAAAQVLTDQGACGSVTTCEVQRLLQELLHGHMVKLRSRCAPPARTRRVRLHPRSMLVNCVQARMGSG